MPVLANHKHELFAQALAKGESASAAYIAAGYARNDGNSIRLKGNEKVAARVAELLEGAAAIAEVTVADIVDMLRADRELAHKCEQSGAAVSASLGIAKVTGNITDKIASTVAVTVDYAAEAKAEIQDIFGPTPHLIEAKHG
jgi:phage terminase small subunit